LRRRRWKDNETTGYEDQILKIDYEKK